MYALLLKLVRKRSLQGEDLSEEINQIRISAFIDTEMVGCLLLISDDLFLRMRQVAVDLSRQRLGIGKALVAFSEKFALEHGYNKIVMHARETAGQFYLNLGYLCVGDPFTEVGIPHIFMEKKLPQK